MSEVKFIDNSQQAIDAMLNAAQVALEACGLQAEGYAKMECPVDTGNLRNSISHTSDGETEYIGTNVEYAAYVELGTSKSKAQPYLQPAVQDHKEEYRRIFEQHLKQN